MWIDPRGAPDYSHHDYAAKSGALYERGKQEGAADRAAGKEPNHYLYVVASPDYSHAKGYREGYGHIAAEQQVGGDYLVWSNEHRAWWGPNHAGYYGNIEAAGRYTREEALGICIGARGGRRFNDNPSEVPILYEDAILFWPNDRLEWREERARYAESYDDV